MSNAKDSESSSSNDFENDSQLLRDALEDESDNAPIEEKAKEDAKEVEEK